jgi:hypothetical protein
MYGNVQLKVVQNRAVGHIAVVELEKNLTDMVAAPGSRS